MSDKIPTRRSFLKQTGIAAVGLTTTFGTVSARSEYDVPIKAVRRLLEQQKIKQAKRFMDKHNMEYTISRGTPSFNDGVSSQRYGDPSEDTDTEIYMVLSEVKDQDGVYNATATWTLSEWNNDIEDSSLEVGSTDSALISWNQNYWQPVEQSRDNVMFTNEDISFEEYRGNCVRVDFDEKQTYWDGKDQTDSGSFSTKLEAINRDLYTGSYNVGANYVHTYDDGGADISWNFGAFTLNPEDSGTPHWHMSTNDEA